MSNIEQNLIVGSCLCGQCSFSVPATSIRFGFASCHCSACRLSHAAPFVQWSGLNADKSEDFIIKSDPNFLSGFKSSPTCTRYFCKTCGCHLYIKYDNNCEAKWAGEVHFPTAIISIDSLKKLEEAMDANGKPRYIHVFSSDRLPCLGDFQQWATTPMKYGGVTGLEPMEKVN